MKCMTLMQPNVSNYVGAHVTTVTIYPSEQFIAAWRRASTASSLRVPSSNPTGDPVRPSPRDSPGPTLRRWASPVCGTATETLPVNGRRATPCSPSTGALPLRYAGPHAHDLPPSSWKDAQLAWIKSVDKAVTEKSLTDHPLYFNLQDVRPAAITTKIQNRDHDAYDFAAHANPATTHKNYDRRVVKRPLRQSKVLTSAFFF